MLLEIKKKLSYQDYNQANFAIERESLRVEQNGELSKIPHPESWGSKLEHPYITTDFSESQVELITPIFQKTESLYHFLDALYDIVVSEINNEILWPQSMPSIIPSNHEIPLAVFDVNLNNGREATEYRKMLLDKYGGSRQLISGIHFNFSFSDEMLTKLYSGYEKKIDFKEFKDTIYMKMARNYLRYRFFLIYFMGATPALPMTYDTKCTKLLNIMGEDARSNEEAISYRNSQCGYQNKSRLLPDYETVETYMRSIESFINTGVISTHKEVYSSIRLKAKDNVNLLDSLSKEGIQYLEIRSIDLNPFEKNGITLNDLNLLHLFMLFLLCEEEVDFKYYQEEANENERKVALRGLNRETTLLRNGEEVSLNKYITDILNKLYTLNSTLALGYDEILNEKRSILNKTIPLRAEKILDLIKKEGYINSFMKLGEAYKLSATSHSFTLKGYEALELSTQILIRECIKYGLRVKVLDTEENFIEISNGKKSEFVKQATKTSLDSYSTVLVMENKVITKEILSRFGIKVPKGKVYELTQDAFDDVARWTNKPVVIKPKSTNYGVGISIFPNGAQEGELQEGMKIAFSYDRSILIEEFIPGKEYRFLVIGEEVIGVLHRVPANIIGDSVHTIEQLVQFKNDDPLRGTGYKKPLEKIMLDAPTDLYLQSQGYTKESVIPKGEVVYLRENSNISTGGDSLDYTDVIPACYKEIAVKAAKAVSARICGVDMMIESLESTEINYAIIELNFNPAIHIHCYPFEGKNRQAAYHILKALAFIQ